MRAIGTTLVLSLAAFLTVAGGCSEKEIPTITNTPPDPNIAVAVTPKNGAMQTGGTMTFGAAITGTTNTKVEWAVFSSAPAFGYISQSGVFTAPSSIAGDSIVVYVEATSSANPGKADTAVIVVHK